MAQDLLIGNSRALTFGQLFSDVAAGLGGMVENTLNAAGSLAGLAVQHAPGAAGAAFNAAVDMGTGINDAVRTAAAPIGGDSAYRFSGLDLSHALGGLKDVSMSPTPANDGQQLGDLSSQLPQFAVQHARGFGHSMVA